VVGVITDFHFSGVTSNCTKTRTCAMTLGVIGTGVTCAFVIAQFVSEVMHVHLDHWLWVGDKCSQAYKVQ
jgi:hypothetical protein